MATAKTYNVELLFEIYRRHNGVCDKVEKEILQNNMQDLPHRAETIKKIAVANDFAGRLEKEREEVARKYEEENDKLDKQLLNITKAGILKYAQGLVHKKYVSEIGLKILWEINWTIRGKPTQITQNLNENIDTFLLEITDPIIPDSTDAVIEGSVEDGNTPRDTK